MLITCICVQQANRAAVLFPALEKTMKIALVTDDGATISAHFGRARAYVAITVEDGAIVHREIRPKSAPHLEGARHGGDDGSHDGPAAHARHDEMIAPVSDCAYLVARGMGRGAYERISAAGLRPVITDLVDPDEAALACAAGRITDLVEQLH
jgi:predicted Fe-Mo cluster-binding NifX family protein